MENKSRIQFTPQDKIFTTGSYLQAFEVEINGIKQWRWILVGQEGNTYFNGESINVYDYADSFVNLIQLTQN
jgi:hypothetical protein